MKNKIILFILLLFSISFFGQTNKTKVPIKGLGEFELGMHRDKLFEILKDHLLYYWKQPKYSDDWVLARDLSLMGTMFDETVFLYDEDSDDISNRDKISSISFTKFFDSPKESSKEFYRMANILKKTYGKPSLTNEQEYSWQNGYESIYISNQIDPTEKKESVRIFCYTTYLPSAQGRSKHNLYGLGEFKFLAGADAVEAAIKHHSTPDTKIIKKKKFLSSKISDIYLTNITLAGYAFDICLLNFDKNGLTHIKLEMDSEENDKNPKAFEELLATFKNDYGKPTANDEGDFYSWLLNDDYFKHLMLVKSYDENTKRTSISIFASIEL